MVYKSNNIAMQLMNTNKQREVFSASYKQSEVKLDNFGLQTTQTASK